MFSLLPAKEKKKLLKEYKFRLAVVGLIFFVALGLILLVVSLPSYLIAKSKNSEIVGRIEAVKQSTIFSEADTLNQELNDAGQKIKSFEDFNSKTRVYEIFAQAISDKSADIRIKGISFDNRVEGGQEKVVLTGVARTRDALRNFVDKLETNKFFSEVDLPVSNFTKEHDLDFTINIIGSE